MMNIYVEIMIRLGKNVVAAEKNCLEIQGILLKRLKLLMDLLEDVNVVIKK